MDDKNEKISGIELFKYTLPYKVPSKIALGTSYEANNVLVKINTKSGLYGLGECSSSYKITGDTQGSNFEVGKYLAKVIKGKNFIAIDNLREEIDNAIVGQTQIKSAFDLALYDLLAKYYEVPLYSLLGGEKRKIYTDCTLFIHDDLEDSIKDAKLIANNGFPAIKVKVGIDDKQDLELVRSLRKELGEDIEIRIDANQGWNFPQAIRMLKKLKKFNLQFAEQPLKRWDYQNLVRLKEKSNVPICLDESLFNEHNAFHLASIGACDIFNIKLGKSGGIYGALKINEIAKSTGMNCMLGCMSESRLGLSAAAHLASARPNIKYLDLDSALFFKSDPIEGGIKYDDQIKGKIILPDNSGHGAKIRDDFLREQEKLKI
jgi:L-alanine-DL-glutamate epimerase-like enolase superfamily enzyme